MPHHDPEVTPEQEARLRRLLSRARHGEPVPVDVATRLDRVLEQLAVEEVDPDPGRSVVDIAARRRRRVTTLLVAAAAVVVVGVGIGQVTGGAEGDMSTASDDSASSADMAEAAGAAESGDLADGGATAYDSNGDLVDGASSQLVPSAPGPASQGRGAPRPPVRLTTDGFAKQAAQLSDRPGVMSLVSSVVPGEALSRAESFVCATAKWGEGRLLAALYDGVPAVLAYRPVAGETQTVDLLRCGTGEILRSTVLPVDG